jgi:hypothetical protein
VLKLASQLQHWAADGGLFSPQTRQVRPLGASAAAICIAGPEGLRGNSQLQHSVEVAELLSPHLVHVADMRAPCDGGYINCRIYRFRQSRLKWIP